MAISLYPHQLDAIKRMKNGCIVYGRVGSGKSLTALGYFYLQNGGEISSLMGEDYFPMGDPPKDLYIITTARKRDTLEWDKELSLFLMSTDKELHLYQNKVVVDSWNNIKKYNKVSDAFFIFDEQRVVGSGEWVRSFLRIAKVNQWVLLSATPGDSWSDYIPVFVANGFYKNRTEFEQRHIVYRYNPYAHYRQIDRYLGTQRLARLRDKILVEMDFERPAVSHHEDIWVGYDAALYKSLMRMRWDIWNDQPFNSASDLCYGLRRAVNTDPSRVAAVQALTNEHPKAIIFYKFDYELGILKSIPYEAGTEIAEWNGHKHQPIPKTDRWVYLTQYTAGCEGWNCIETDTVIFYSQDYSYKVMEQASGRIDRLNTPFTDLWYYHLKSRSGIDIAIGKALQEKKKFNEGRFVQAMSK